MRAREGNTRRVGHTKPNATRNNKKPTNKSKTKRNGQKPRNQKGGAGMAEEDRGREGRTYHIRIAIGQLSGDQWGDLDHHPDEHLSVVKLGILTTPATWWRGW